jgi:hypothetical protein
LSESPSIEEQQAGGDQHPALLLCTRDAHLDIDGHFPEMRGKEGGASSIADLDGRYRFRVKAIARCRAPMIAGSGGS